MSEKFGIKVAVATLALALTIGANGCMSEGGNSGRHYPRPTPIVKLVKNPSPVEIRAFELESSTLVIDPGNAVILVSQIEGSTNIKVLVTTDFDGAIVAVDNYQNTKFYLTDNDHDIVENAIGTIIQDIPEGTECNINFQSYEWGREQLNCFEQ